LAHRFVLHSLLTFNRWNAQYHRRSTARIGSPTGKRASLLFFCATLPACLLVDAWVATALTLGLALGYLGYSLAHRATHYCIVFIEGQRNVSGACGAWGTGWLYRRIKFWLQTHHRLHAMHHAVHQTAHPHHPSTLKNTSSHFSVTSVFGSRAFGSDVGAIKLTLQLEHRDPKSIETPK